MAIFVSLVNFTDQGLRIVKHTTERAESLRQAARDLGAEVKDIFWTMGVYDLVMIVDAPDDETVETLFLSIGSLGNVRSHTMRGFTADEMTRILDRIP